MIERLATLPQVNDEYRPFSIAPDGATVAFSWYKEGDWQIFLADAGGGEPRRAAALDDACICPQFSPDGRFVYFARDDKGSERFDLYRLELATSELTNLLPDTPELSPLPEFDLSPDGRRIALLTDHDSSYALAIMPAQPCQAGAGLQFLVQTPYVEWGPRWSPDGRRVAFAGFTGGQETAIFVVDTDTGRCSSIGDPPLQACGPAWSADGRRIAFHGGPFDHSGIGLYDVGDGTVSWAWASDQDAHGAAWSPDGRSLAFLIDEGVGTSLWYVDLVAQEPVCISDAPGNHYAPAFTPDGAAVVFCLSAPERPTALCRLEVESGELTYLTPGLPADLAEQRFVSGGLVWFTSRDHLTEVPGLLAVPDEPNGAAVVMLHGGPTWHHSNEWDALRQAFLAAGVITLSPNYRGSDGYGRTWQLANRWLFGQGEVQDCAGTHDFLVAQGCDPDRVAVTGRSHGGYLTMACLWQFPELWACGVAGVPYMDHVDAQTDPAVREDLRWWDHENVGDLEKDRDRLVYYSPINHLDRIKAPVLLLAAENDPRCPPGQIADVVSGLTQRGVEADAHIYPAEGHSISSFASRLDYDRRTVAFILRHLGVTEK
jgi:dipeptidyl aminopeptidase/acylaminoacyl peptidase